MIGSSGYVPGTEDRFRRVEVVGRTGVELIGAGDVLRPWSGDDEKNASVPASLLVEVYQPTSLAVLDREFIAATAWWPQVLPQILERMSMRTTSLAFSSRSRGYRCWRFASSALCGIWPTAGAMSTATGSCYETELIFEERDGKTLRPQASSSADTRADADPDATRASASPARQRHDQSSGAQGKTPLHMDGHLLMGRRDGVASLPTRAGRAKPLQISLNGGRGECGQLRTCAATHTTGGHA
ncbi:MAG TPA: hypothetical protein VK631_10895 [Solirubrobacteraceae bacterium]|nr:hypothetical protein [Solirubrobacteraceae bacterium]